MSFFADLLVGVAGGAATGRLSEIEAQEKEAAAEKKAAYAAALQAQKDAAAEARLDARLGSSGAGKGGASGTNLFERVLSAKTPEDQAAIVRAVEAFGGKSGAANLAETAFGKPMAQQRPADYVGLPGQSDIGPDARVVERVEYDKQKGVQALQRLYAMLNDPGKVDDFAKGERQFGLNDNAAAVEGKVLKRGGTLEEGAAAFQKYSGTTDDTQKNALAAARIDATNNRTDANTRSASEKLTAKQIKDIEQMALDYRKLAKDAGSKQRDEYLKKAQDIEDSLTASRAMATQPPSPSRPWTASTGAAPSVQDSINRFKQR